MNKLYINEDSISKFFWSSIYEIIDSDQAIEDKVNEILDSSKKLQKDFPKNIAGSISKKTCKELIAISKYFSPSYVCEIGTYIGRSTISILAGSNENLKEIHTCDLSFDLFELSNKKIEFDSKIRYYPKTTSIKMFEEYKNNNSDNKFDFFFIDGRISNEDTKYIESLKTNDAIFVLDDFEGTEKGVYNSFVLQQKFKNLHLIRPSQNNSNYGVSNGKIAILMPYEIIKITKQQYLPSNI